MEDAAEAVRLGHLLPSLQQEGALAGWVQRRAHGALSAQVQHLSRCTRCRAERALAALGELLGCAAVNQVARAPPGAQRAYVVARVMSCSAFAGCAPTRRSSAAHPHPAAADSLLPAASVQRTAWAAAIFLPGDGAGAAVDLCVEADALPAH